MKTLALETSAKACSVALMEGDTLLAQTMQNAGFTHSRTLMPMLDALLKGAGCTIQDVDKIAVAIGPGSFTGLRIGLATAKGLAFAADKPLVGVSSLLAMAHQAMVFVGSNGDIICPVMDARRGQVYNALFESNGTTLIRIEQDRTTAIEDLFTPRAKPYLLVGDGAALCAAWMAERNIPFRILPAHLVQQSAWGVAMAARTLPGKVCHDVNPQYIRPSQAERERAARLETEA